jgi:hypothetical protein
MFNSALKHPLKEIDLIKCRRKEEKKKKFKTIISKSCKTAL